MKVCILGGDNRQLEIIDSLRNNCNVTLVGYENLEKFSNLERKKIYDIDPSDYDSFILPVSGISDSSCIKTGFGEAFTLRDNFFDNTKKNALIFTGVMTDKLKSMLETSKRNAVVLMQDKDVIEQNTIPTVEGIIADVIYNTDITVNESNVLVIGYGNIGKRLVTFLNNLGAYVYVGVLNEEEANKASVNVQKAIVTSNEKDMATVLSFSDIIINTAPAQVLTGSFLDATKKSAYILDVSSYPHGVNFEHAEEIGIKNKLLPGIPSKVAPKTAGLILTKKIQSKIKGVK